MKRAIILVLIITGMLETTVAQTTTPKPLKIIFIRHGEKPVRGDNLNCAGINRSKALPAIIIAKFGLPDFVYVPTMVQGVNTYISRMFQTVIPLVSKYNIPVNTAHNKLAAQEIAADLKSKTGTILVCWEHKAIAPIVTALGIELNGLAWQSDDFDTIWIVTFNNGKAVFTKDKQGLKPSDICDF